MTTVPNAGIELTCASWIMAFLRRAAKSAANLLIPAFPSLLEERTKQEGAGTPMSLFRV
jgi:hypothetical protein